MPVAVNLYKIRQGKDTGGDLFRSIQSQKPQYQGLWTLSPDGQVFTAHQNYKSQETWTEEVLDTLAAGLKAFGPVTPRQARAVHLLPYRGIGVKPDGSVCLALYTRYVRGGGNRLAPPSVYNGSRWMWEGDLKPDGPPVIDTLSLTAGEWATFMPAKSAVGTEWIVPEAVARKFTRALSPNSDQSTMPRPEEASVVELKATVESVEAGQARIRLAGRWEMKHLYEGKPSYGWATAEGAALYDLRKKTLRSVLLAFSGAYRMVPPYDKEDRPIGAVVEWQAEPSPASKSVLLRGVGLSASVPAMTTSRWASSRTAANGAIQGRATVNVRFLEFGEKQQLEAEYLVCCIPFAILKKIAVTPAWLESKRFVLDNVVFGSQSRVL